jgi:hypothetical protein
MKFYRLWYVKRGDDVTGPFPLPLLAHYAEVGRIRPDDEVSPDKASWLPFSEVPELVPRKPSEGRADPEKKRWQEERLLAARRWADERYRPDRRDGEDAASREKWLAERRSGERRQQPENPDTVLLRQYRAIQAPPPALGPERFFGVMAVLAALVALPALAVMFYAPVNPVKVGVAPLKPQCRRPAAPQANWRGCDKQGAWLKGADLSSADLGAARLNSANLSSANLSYANLAEADLSYADLGGARVVGGNLNNADLRHADLGGADMRYADLTGAGLAGAELSGARLDEAIWTDGRKCGQESIGHCR